ncbi:uncharacterized protein LOC129597480 [Paramacrobiotus metropolitanus]|uniref:uncharacterized protein LOC129597480 n=1 Tax=Paramacrobiotus metropolitanus TaxID=2943436 RepID=UPI0024464825|nr:uncharacterized protein LOC129597480 [Paramacrobiotus metropolitanus]XP_055351024.1 uncharacterized protein LOC129597480 [Paramacrobiotus metropolitanus]
MAYLSFLMSRTGILKLLETIIGIVVIAIVSQYGIHVFHYPDMIPASSFLLGVAAGGLIVSFIELVTFFYDDDTRYAVRKSLFEVMFCCVMCALYLAAACTMVYFVHVRARLHYETTNHEFDIYPGCIAATVFAFINMLLYLIDTILAYSDMKATVAGGPRYFETVVYK